jgi:predicted RNase H-like HicB family nuclease
MKMNEEIKIRKLTEEEGGGYLAEYTYLKGCMADGETKIEALQELEKAKESWLLAANELGMEIPEKVKYKRINITFPEKLLEKLDEVLKNELHMSRSAFFQQSVQQSLLRK